MRSDKRSAGELRPLSFEKNFIKHPEGSCLVRMGDTWVLCTASVEERVPPFLEGKKTGWVTAEYSMLPRSTHTRTRREASTGRPNGRTQEIQRLIGRALRATIDTKILGERTITIDCDVLQADGGTRTASINGGFVALALAMAHLQKKGAVTASPIQSPVAAVSLGIAKGEVLVDLDYGEDSNCDVDMNVVMLEGQRIVELQGTAEKSAFTPDQSQNMIALASNAIVEILEAQKRCLTSS
jgi:ribonuclease PH